MPRNFNKSRRVGQTCLLAGYELLTQIALTEWCSYAVWQPNSSFKMHWHAHTFADLSAFVTKFTDFSVNVFPRKRLATNLETFWKDLGYFPYKRVSSNWPVSESYTSLSTSTLLSEWRRGGAAVCYPDRGCAPCERLNKRDILSLTFALSDNFTRLFISALNGII